MTELPCVSSSVLETIAQKRIVPVIKITDPKDAKPLAEALLQGGLPLAEITFRSDAALESIRTAAQIEGMAVGAGTIVHLEQAKKAVDAGAKFLLTPGFSEAIARFCADNQILLFPGAATPTELMMVMEYGLPVVKFFPAEQMGGVATIKALAAPFSSIRFMPTGGINPGNLKEYLSFDRVIACGGSWMVKEAMIREGRFEDIRQLTAQAVELAKN